jgi:hypothetical protein
MLNLHKFDNAHLHLNDLENFLSFLFVYYFVNSSVDDDQTYKVAENVDRSNESMMDAHIELLSLLSRKKKKEI